MGGGWGPPLADERRGRVPSGGLRQCGIRGGNDLEPRRVCGGGGRPPHLAEFGAGMGTPPSGGVAHGSAPSEVGVGPVDGSCLAASGRSLDHVMPGHARGVDGAGGCFRRRAVLGTRRMASTSGTGAAGGLVWHFSPWRAVRGAPLGEFRGAIDPRLDATWLGMVGTGGRVHGGVVRGRPAIGISMIRAVSWGGLMMSCGLTLAQGPPPEADPALWEAVSSGCLTSEEAEVLMAAGWPGQAPQQTVVRSLGLERGSQTVRCLLSLPGWPDRLQLRSGRAAEKCSLRFRGGAGQGSHGGRTRGQVQWRQPLAAFVWRGRMSAEGGVGTLWTSTLSGRLPSGQWAVGSLMPKVGQGAMLWSAGAFEGLGGMEGSHRLPSGWIPAWGRQRGVLDGLAWKRTEDTSLPSTGLHGALMGQWWRSGRLLAAWGRVAGVRMVWRWGNGPSSRGRWAWGSHGGGEWRGWSTRWGAAAFPGGWAARGSVLRSWTAQWEAHGLWERQHPDHPGWHSGEWRASMPEGGARPSWNWTLGVVFNGEVHGALRWRRSQGAGPWDHPREEVEWRVRHRAHQWRLQTGYFAGHPDTFTWQARYGCQGAWGAPEEGLRVRLHLLASGQGSQRGGAVALTGRWAARGGSRWTFGMGQGWGSPHAPAAYVTGWDDRVAHRFQGRQQQAFLRWRTPGGRWECRIRWPAPWCDVEFHPHRRRPRPR